MKSLRGLSEKASEVQPANFLFASVFLLFVQKKNEEPRGFSENPTSNNTPHTTPQKHEALVEARSKV